MTRWPVKASGWSEVSAGSVKTKPRGSWAQVPSRLRVCEEGWISFF